MADQSVKVAVRVRPFNAREMQEGAVLCVDMTGTMTQVVNPENQTKREFYYDYCYWSHDGFVTDPDTGYASKDGPGSKYADQQVVFETLGRDVLSAAFEGFHVSLFAYGQTGAGKSYSMVGYGSNKGIVPITSDAIFKQINENKNPNVRYEVKASMLEIYNEQIQDLLAAADKRVQGGLKIRETKGTGVYVENLSKLAVASYEEIDKVFETGTSHRTIAATQMNATSSRAHTVLTISFTQVFYDENTGQPLNRKQSDINLIDLAGSERAAKTAATGDRLKEGSNINQSLSILGKVITELAKKGSGKKSGIIPYRESKLTRLLQNALGGNSKTTMIAAISPATYNYEETMSTLRYADQVKAIKNVAVVNETPQEKLIRELKEENERLKAMMAGNPGALSGKALMQSSSYQPNEEDEDMRAMYEERIRQLEEDAKNAQMTLTNATDADAGNRQTLQNRLQASAAVTEVTTPHLSNLNEDPLLTGYVKHALKEGINRIGKQDESNPPDIKVDGLGVTENHCQILFEGGDATLIPSDNPASKTMVNGKVLSGRKELDSGDRIRFGNHVFFLYVDPDEIGEKHDWEEAVKEANEAEVQAMLGKQAEELKKKEEEMKQKLEEEMKKQQQLIEQERQKIEEMKNSQSQEDTAAAEALKEKERELKKKQVEMDEEMRKKERELKKFEEDRLALERLTKILTGAIQSINEINERAVLLGKEVSFGPMLQREGDGSGTMGSGLQNTTVKVRVFFPGLGDEIPIYWDLDKLDNRLVDVQDLCNSLAMGGDPNQLIKQLGYDPFHDTIENIEGLVASNLIGYAYVYLDTLYYLMAIEEDYIRIIDDKGVLKGSLKVSIKPEVGSNNLDDYDNLKELISKELSVEIAIKEAVDIPEEYANNVYCSYTMTTLGDQVQETDKSDGFSTNPKFNYKRKHNAMITQELADEFLNHALAIKVQGAISEDKVQEGLAKLRKLGEKQDITSDNMAQYQAINQRVKEGHDLLDVPGGHDSSFSGGLTMTLAATQDNSRVAELERMLKSKEDEINLLKKDRVVAADSGRISDVAGGKSKDPAKRGKGSCTCEIF